MDILRPQIQRIGGICYRINPGSYNTDFEQGTPQPYYEFDSECPGLIEPENEENYDIEKDQNGRFRTSFHVPKLFFPYIIGSKGSTKKRLEGETRTTITVPKLGCVGNIVITGADKQNVSSARNRINMVVMSARKKQKPTHFLSIPLINDIFVQRFKQFKEEVLENCPGIEAELFQYPETLHLTLGILKLCDSVDREQATAALEHCHTNIILGLLGGRTELRLRMQGLDYMNDDPSALHVLYAKVEALGEPSLLQNLVDGIALYFTQQGLIEKNNADKVLIHATLMNSKFLKHSKGQDDEKLQTRKTFDASKVLEKYKHFNFGEESISRLDLSAMHTYTENGYWQATATIDLFKF